MNSVQNCVVTASLATAMLTAIGMQLHPVAAALASHDWQSVLKAKMPDPNEFSCPEDFAKHYLAYNIMRKYADFPVEIDRPAVALEGFLQSETKCRGANASLLCLPYFPGVALNKQPGSVLDYARRLIRRALGKFSWKQFETSCDFSNGASTKCKRKASHPIEKLSGKPHVTLNCRDLAVHYIWCNTAWRRHCQDLYGRDSDPYTWVEVVPGSIFRTVPKDSLKDRPICVEPDLNMFFQKGIGAMIRKALRRVGINLNCQERNQNLAFLGSIDDELATIDLSSASDSVSLRLCEILLPADWLEAIMLTRSRTVTLPDGSVHTLQKVSSMGNGFTFELESLIFWALSYASSKVSGSSVQHLSVYGDDIIVETTACDVLLRTLNTSGFETNKNKTFVSGPFRESCGKHYFKGYDVSPFFVKNSVTTHQEVYHFCNSVQEWSRYDERAESCIDLALRAIPPRARCYVPMHFSTKAGLRTRDPRGRWCRKRQSWKFKYLREVRSEHHFNGPVAYLGSLLLNEQRGPGNYASTLKGARRVRVVHGYSSVWRQLA